jgi:mannose-6-phosphate isomerase-like protein (cupin superfamily)
LYNSYDPYHYWVNIPRDNSNYMRNPSDWHSWLNQVNESLWNYRYEPTAYEPIADEVKHDPFDYLEMGTSTATDHGAAPFVINIDDATTRNNTFRTALWTGNHLQVTLMSINAGDSIGLEIHPDVDQFLRIEEGEGIVRMGPTRDSLDFERRVSDDFAIMIPAGTWHDLINTGTEPLKVYSIYAPPEHPHGTVHQTKADEAAAEGNQRRY